MDSVRSRVRWVGRLRRGIVRHAAELAALGSFPGHPPEEVLLAEVLPLLEACRFLEREAEITLRPRRAGGLGGAWWMGRPGLEVRREPFGLVAVISPSNYPLFLGAVHGLQALVAGNSVLWKPAPGCERVALRLVELARDAGLDCDLLEVLEETGSTGAELLCEEVDKVVFTGSSATGTRVLGALANRAIPAVVELSGNDAVLVRSDADVELAARALAFGLRFNRSRTCIAPRRVFVHARVRSELEERLRALLSGSPALECALSTAEQDCLGQRVEEALRAGASSIFGGCDASGVWRFPCVLGNVAPSMRLMREEMMAPVLSMREVESDAEALEALSASPYALGASIFTRDEERGRLLAASVCAGVVTLNDLIVPTADPRVPFGGRKASGFGVTRGREGLLEMTQTKSVIWRNARSARHLSGEPASREVALALVRLTHSDSWMERFRALWELIRLTSARGALGRGAEVAAKSKETHI
ncbi:MAG: hypothetical protein RLZZ244_2522 [Verrucomicrobiota bacterium]|jgi:acyl-CoA reductase-like NAD-dependent aldehyde dehydrogenase